MKVVHNREAHYAGMTIRAAMPGCDSGMAPQNARLFSGSDPGSCLYARTDQGGPCLKISRPCNSGL